MIINLDSIDIYLKPGPTDMRKQINGLSEIVLNDLELDLFSNSLFLFSNRYKKLIKILYWDKNGFCLWSKRLEKDHFPWPATGEDALKLSKKEFEMLLSGIDFWKAHKEIKNKEIF